MILTGADTKESKCNRVQEITPIAKNSNKVIFPVETKKVIPGPAVLKVRYFDVLQVGKKWFMSDLVPKI